MPCEYCLRYFGHSSSCPNYEEPMSNHNCSECGENILIGEKYIMNDYGDYAHLECVDNVKDLVKFLGYDIREME